MDNTVNHKNSLRSTGTRKRSKKSMMNEKLSDLENRINVLEDTTAILVSRLLEKEESKVDELQFEPQMITPKYPPVDQSEYNAETANTGLSNLFITAIEPDINTQLLEAVKNGNYILTKKLIDDYGADINIKDSFERSLLIIAYENILENQDPIENSKIIKYLLKKRGLDSKIKREYTAFVKAYNKKHRELGGTRKRKMRLSRRK